MKGIEAYVKPNMVPLRTLVQLDWLCRSADDFLVHDSDLLVQSYEKYLQETCVSDSSSLVLQS